MWGTACTGALQSASASSSVYPGTVVELVPLLFVLLLRVGLAETRLLDFGENRQERLPPPRRSPQSSLQVRLRSKLCDPSRQEGNHACICFVPRW